MPNLARFAITGNRPLHDVEIEVSDGQGGWVETETLELHEAYGTIYKAQIDAPVGSEYRVRHQEFYAGTASPFSDWTVPGVVIVPEPGLIAAILGGVVLLELLRRRKERCERR